MFSGRNIKFNANAALPRNAIATPLYTVIIPLSVPSFHEPVVQLKEMFLTLVYLGLSPSAKSIWRYHHHYYAL
jgi:hypothetical protein